MSDSNVIQMKPGACEQPEDKPFELTVTGTGPIVNALKALYDGRDRVLIEAVNFKIGEGWSLTDVVNRGEFVIGPDKMEHFVFDGEVLVVFWPHETVMTATSLTIKQKYRKLYSIKGNH